MAEQFVVALLRSLGTQIDISLVKSGKYLARGIRYNFFESRVGLHLAGNPRRLYAMYSAWNGGDYRATRLLQIYRAWEIADKMSGEFKPANMGSAVGRVTYIFQRPGFYISDVAANSSRCYKFIVLVVMAQFSLAQTEITPKFGVYVVDISIELRLHKLSFERKVR